MVLVDTSVLIDFLRKRKNRKTDLLQEVLDRRLPWGICDYVYQEILQGSKDEREFLALKDYFGTIPDYFLKKGKLSFEQAAMLNVRCRLAGITVRSTIDLLIVQIAVENDVALLHNDSDFDNIKKIVPEFRIYD